jgi:RNase H-fold protein (predicted Holliday junction resolvase)
MTAASGIVNPSLGPGADPVILGFDPGRGKCGLAIVQYDRRALWHEVVPTQGAIAQIQQLLTQYAVNLIVMGDQTASREWQQAITQQFPTLPIQRVDERYSSLEARDRYWQLYPAQGLTQLIPQGMRTVPRPIDDLVAILLVERYLDRQGDGRGER